jgi:alpha-beta hydrolase superfamily lysophospholipase
MGGPLTVLPEDMEPTTRGFLAGHGKTPLAYLRWEHERPVGRVVVSHGYGEHGERYRHVAHWLHGLGWSVSALDHQGFGRSGGVRGDARGIHPFVEDLALFLRHERRFDMDRAGARPRFVDGVPMPPLPVCPQILLAHSFGGLVALLDLLWHADTMEGLILTSPALALRPMGPILRLLQKLFLLVAPHHSLDLPNDKSLVCSDPVLVQRYWEDPLCHRRGTAAFIRALEQGREEILGLGAELDRPILLLEASEDTVVDPDGAEPLWSSIRIPLLERHRLDGFRHEIFHDLKRQEAMAWTEPWLNRFLSTWERNLQPQAHTSE